MKESIIISIILIAILILYINPNSFFSIISKANIYYLLASTLFLILMHLTMAYRIRYLASTINEDISMMVAFNTHMLGMLLSDITPGRIGYLMSPVYLKVKGLNGHKAAFSVITAQPFDMMFKFIGVVLGIITLGYKLLPINLLVILFLLSLFMTFFIFLLVFSKRFLSLLFNIYRMVSHFPLILNLNLHIERLFSSIKNMQSLAKSISRYGLKLSALVFLGYTFRVLNWLFAALAFNIVLQPLLFYIIQPLVSIIDFLPLPSAAGTGFSEFGMGLALSVFDIPIKLSITYAIFIRLQSITVDLLGILPLAEVLEKRKSFNI